VKEVIELTLAEALQWIRDGRIQDGKTIILLCLQQRADSAQRRALMVKQ